MEKLNTRVLIIDDDSFMRELLRSVLESDGHEVVDRHHAPRARDEELHDVLP